MFLFFVRLLYRSSLMGKKSLAKISWQKSNEKIEEKLKDIWFDERLKEFKIPVCFYFLLSYIFLRLMSVSKKLYFRMFGISDSYWGRHTNKHVHWKKKTMIRNFNWVHFYIENFFQKNLPIHCIYCLIYWSFKKNFSEWNV